MISRIADHCFWFGRYVERAESTARALVATRNLSLDAELEPSECWLPVLIISGEDKRFSPQENEALGEQVERYMTWSEDSPSSLKNSINAARVNARAIRDVLSLEVFETTNELYLWSLDPATQEEFHENRFGFYRKIRQSSQLCLGLLRSTMLHDTPMDIIWLGVLLERVSQTARLLDVHHYMVEHLDDKQRITEDAVWLTLLRACSGFESFVKRNQGKISESGVASFLFGEPQFPRSVRYCVKSAYDRFCAIRPPNEPDLPGIKTYETLRQLDSWMSQRVAEPIDLTQLHTMLTHVVNESAQTCDSLAQELFGYT